MCFVRLCYAMRGHASFLAVCESGEARRGGGGGDKVHHVELALCDRNSSCLRALGGGRVRCSCSLCLPEGIRQGTVGRRGESAGREDAPQQISSQGSSSLPVTGLYPPGGCTLSGFPSRPTLVRMGTALPPDPWSLALKTLRISLRSTALLYSTLIVPHTDR